MCEVGGVAVGSRVVALLVARDADGQTITHGGEQVAASFLTPDASSTLYVTPSLCLELAVE